MTESHPTGIPGNAGTSPLPGTPPTPPASPYSAPAPAPVRWGGVVWGALLTLFAALTLYVVSSAERAEAVRSWLVTLNPGSAWALGAAVLGLIIVVSALLGGIRASQRRRVHPRG